MKTYLEISKHIQKMVISIENYIPIQNSEGSSFVAYFRYNSDYSTSLQKAYREENLNCNDLQQGFYYKVQSDMKTVSKIKLKDAINHITEWSMETGEKWIEWQPISNSKYKATLTNKKIIQLCYQN